MSGRRGIIVVASASIAIASLAFAALNQFTLRLVWNASPSAPIGLYRIDDRAAKIGEFVLVEPSGMAAELLAEREYLPSGTPLIKRIAALTGEEICRRNEHIFINNMYVATALLTDSKGRKMPQWSGCFTLKEDEIFLLNAHEKSLDGRYFGATKTSVVIGVTIPVFVKE